MEGQVPYVSGASYGTLGASVSLIVMWGDGIKLLLSGSAYRATPRVPQSLPVGIPRRKRPAVRIWSFWNTQKSAAAGFLGAF